MAVELAALLPPNTPLDLPCTIEALHPRARANLLAVSRALERNLAGLPSPPRQQAPRRLQNLEIQRPEYLASDDAMKGNHAGASLAGNSGVPSLPTSPPNFGEKFYAVGRKPSDTKPGDEADRIAEEPGVLSADAVIHVTALKQWAIVSPHVPAPASPLSEITDAPDPTAWISALFSDDLSVEASSALIAAVGPACGARVAELLTIRVLIPRISVLSAPAPRDFMKAMSTIAEYHWRAVLPIYDLIRKQSAGKPLGAPAAEVLVRVADKLSIQGAHEALLLCCEGLWREEGIRVVEALLVKCKTEPGVADPLVAGLDSNLRGLEGSLRFGKLLLTVVRDVPGLSGIHLDTLRAICSKSTVFLGKRALTMLDDGK
jgi:hypothetical protein